LSKCSRFVLRSEVCAFEPTGAFAVSCPSWAANLFATRLTLSLTLGSQNDDLTEAPKRPCVRPSRVQCPTTKLQHNYREPSIVGAVGGNIQISDAQVSNQGCLIRMGGTFKRHPPSPLPSALALWQLVLRYTLPQVLRDEWVMPCCVCVCGGSCGRFRHHWCRNLALVDAFASPQVASRGVSAAAPAIPQKHDREPPFAGDVGGNIQTSEV
jgi:hypothetical protein